MVNNRDVLDLYAYLREIEAGSDTSVGRV